MNYKMGLKNVHDPKYDTYAKFDDKGITVLPVSVSYKYDYPAVDNQGGLGTCVAFGTRKMFEFYYLKRHGVHNLVSARAIYAQAKNQFWPTDLTDDGLNVSDGLNAVKEYYVWESDYSSLPDSDESDFPSYLEVAPANLHQTNFLVKNFVTVANDVFSMRKALYKNGPFLIGTNWANSWFNTPSSGIMPAPDVVAGGHCVNIVGYDDNIVNEDGTKGAFEIINNWTDTWANKGYAWLAYSFVNANDGQGNSFWPSDVYTVQV